MKIYVASSWRCIHQPLVVMALRDAGHEVYDFKNPSKLRNGFSWDEIDTQWKSWSVDQFHRALLTEPARAGFESDWNAMEWAEACVMVNPCGRSAHLEAGYFVGAKKILVIFSPELPEPELMYKMADGLATHIGDVLQILALLEINITK